MQGEKYRLYTRSPFFDHIRKKITIKSLKLEHLVIKKKCVFVKYFFKVCSHVIIVNYYNDYENLKITQMLTNELW